MAFWNINSALALEYSAFFVEYKTLLVENRALLGKHMHIIHYYFDRI